MTINFKKFTEALKGKQKNLDVNKNGKLDADDFKKLRGEETEIAEAADMHPDAQKVLKHIKPEHHAKYTPDLTKKHYTGSYADRSAVLNAAEKAGHLKEQVELDEAIVADDYTSTSEKSQFGGHRPHVVNKDTGKTMMLGQHAYKSPEHAKAHAKAYLTAYANSGMHAADRASFAYAKANKQHMVKEDAKLSYSMLMQALAEAKKQKDDEMEDMMGAEGEQGEQKISKRADTKPDSLGRKRKQAFKVHDGDSDGERLGEEVIEIEEGEVSKIEGGIRHKGTYGSEYETDRNGEEKKKAVVSAEKRGRGRPKKGSDSSGEVKKYTFNTLLNRLSTPSK